MRRTILIAAASVMLVFTGSSPAHAASTPDLCNWTSTATVAARIQDPFLPGETYVERFGPGSCTELSQQVRHTHVPWDREYLTKWRDPETNWGGTRWVPGPYNINQAATGYVIRILDSRVKG